MVRDTSPKSEALPVVDIVIKLITLIFTSPGPSPPAIIPRVDEEQPPEPPTIF